MARGHAPRFDWEYAGRCSINLCVAFGCHFLEVGDHSSLYVVCLRIAVRAVAILIVRGWRICCGLLVTGFSSSRSIGVCRSARTAQTRETNSVKVLAKCGLIDSVPVEHHVITSSREQEEELCRLTFGGASSVNAAGIFRRKPSDWSTYGGEEAGGGSNASEDGPPCVMGRATGRFTKSEWRFSEAALRGKCWSHEKLPNSGLSGLSGVQAQIVTRLRAQARERGRMAHSKAKRRWFFLQVV